MAHFIYGVATNTGKGFFTAEDRMKYKRHKLCGMLSLTKKKLNQATVDPQT